jgi:endonuclease/exonuclease/phosphatase family metal-dependent hydrolase
MIKTKSSVSEFRDIFSSILILFFIDQITFLVESIYMLNLLNTQVDIRALGILFLISAVFIFFIKSGISTLHILVAVMLLCMLLSSFLSPAQRIFSSGLGAGAFLIYFGIYLSDEKSPQVNWGQSAALATLLSVLFRTVGNTLDVSISGDTVFINWILIGLAGIFYLKTNRADPDQAAETADKIKSNNISDYDVLLNALGLFGSFIFIYFVFASPGVLARWSEGQYAWIIIILSFSMLLVVFLLSEKFYFEKRATWILLVWNTVFLILFIANIRVQQVQFPTVENITPIFVENGNDGNAIITYLMLIFSPVIFMNISWFTNSLNNIKSNKIAWSFTVGGVIMIASIFMLIFTNTWGYVGSISRIFRNQFHVPFLIAGIMSVLPFLINKRILIQPRIFRNTGRWTKIMAALFVVCISGFFLFRSKTKIDLSNNRQGLITLMTYNIQQGVDFYGNKNFQGQLKRIAEINPDILCLQESDAARISGGNSDVVRYFSEKLGYYSYYGPKTIAGTYGTAILSKFPLQNCNSVFTYSSKDEIGTAFADVSIGSRKITIINSHPAGDQRSREEHIKMILSRIEDKQNVIAMGDYNFQQDSPYYQMITEDLYDSWLRLYPDAIGNIDMDQIDLNIKERNSSSGELLTGGKIDMTNRIDHIFLSDALKVKEAHYLPAPESATDHPLYWTVVGF